MTITPDIMRTAKALWEDLALSPYVDDQTKIEWIATAIQRHADEAGKARGLLDVRDEFIVGKGLWHEFVASLKSSPKEKT